MKSAVSTVLMMIRVILADLDFPDFPPPEMSLISPELRYLDQLVVALVVQVAKLHRLSEKCCTPQVDV